MRTARDIIFNEVELVGSINIESLLEIIIFIIFIITTDDSNLIILEIVGVTV